MSEVTDRTQQLGGLAMLRAIAAPFPGIRFVPTGGIDAGNMGANQGDRRVAAVTVAARHRTE